MDEDIKQSEQVKAILGDSVKKLSGEDLNILLTKIEDLAVFLLDKWEKQNHGSTLHELQVKSTQ